MFVVNDIKTGFTKLGRGTPSSWTETELICLPSGHTQNIIYKNIGTTSGYIEFDYKINTTESFSGHCIFRIRSKYLTQGQYYNQDVFYGIALQWWGANDSSKSLYLIQDGESGQLPTSSNVLYKFSNDIANKTLRIKFFWNEDYVYVSVNDEKVTLSNMIKHDYTYIDFGFANYAGTITRTIKEIIPPTIDVLEVNDDKLHLTISDGTYSIESIDILYNNTVIESIESSSDYIHSIDKSKLAIGYNNISVRINSDFIIPIEKTVRFKNELELLHPTSSLLDVASCIKVITNSNKLEFDLLKNILSTKNVEVSEEDKMSDLIGKVDLLGEYDNPILYIYKDGVFNENYTRTPLTNSSNNSIIEYGENSFTLKGITSSYWVSRLAFEKVDFTLYSKLCVECSLIAGTSQSTKNATINVNSVIHKETLTNPLGVNFTSSFNKDVKILDVSNINGVYYLNLTTYDTNLTIYNIWLEK